MVEDVVGALLENEGATVGCPGRADHAHAGGLCELDRRDAHGAAGAVDEHGLSASSVRTTKERAMRGRGGHTEAGALANDTGTANRKICCGVHTIRSAYVPYEVPSAAMYTLFPRCHSVTALPIDSTSPAPSKPGV